MKNFLSAFGLAACVFLSGCASGGMGLAESPVWHATAPMDAKIAYFKKKCEAYGHQAGSPEMTRCLQTSMEASEGNATARMQAIGAMNQQMNQNRPITCTTTFNTTTCR
jgi:hypothetical protein